MGNGRRLDPALRKRIDQLLEQGLSHKDLLMALGNPVKYPASGVSSAAKRTVEMVAEKINSSRAVAEALVHRFGSGPENKATRLSVELMHSIILDLLLKSGAEDASADPAGVTSPMDAMRLAKALEHLARASSQDAELISKTRAGAAEEARAKAALAAEGASRQLGLNKAQAAFIRAEILGLEVTDKP